VWNDFAPCCIIQCSNVVVVLHLQDGSQAVVVSHDWQRLAGRELHLGHRPVAVKRVSCMLS
jgi:hypothetical protein